MNTRLPNPANPEYRNSYDRIFGRKDETTCPNGEHEYRKGEIHEEELTYPLQAFIRKEHPPFIWRTRDLEPTCKRCGYSPLRTAPR